MVSHRACSGGVHSSGIGAEAVHERLGLVRGPGVFVFLADARLEGDDASEAPAAFSASFAAFSASRAARFAAISAFFAAFLGLALRLLLLFALLARDHRSSGSPFRSNEKAIRRFKRDREDFGRTRTSRQGAFG